jgi:Zn-finger nucleic acid-binding protein
MISDIAARDWIRRNATVVPADLAAKTLGYTYYSYLQKCYDMDIVPAGIGTKTCAKCNETLPLSHFGVSHSQPDHHLRMCRKCFRLANRSHCIQCPRCGAVVNSKQYDIKLDMCRDCAKELKQQEVKTPIEKASRFRSQVGNMSRRYNDIEYSEAFAAEIATHGMALTLDKYIQRITAEGYSKQSLLDLASCCIMTIIETPDIK